MSLLHHSSMLVWTGYWAGVTIEHPLAIIFAESLEILVLALEAQYEDAKPLGLQDSWIKTKVQIFGDLLDEAV